MFTQRFCFLHSKRRYRLAKFPLWTLVLAVYWGYKKMDVNSESLFSRNHFSWLTVYRWCQTNIQIRALTNHWSLWALHSYKSHIWLYSALVNCELINHHCLVAWKCDLHPHILWQKFFGFLSPIIPISFYRYYNSNIPRLGLILYSYQNTLKS